MLTEEREEQEEVSVQEATPAPSGARRLDIQGLRAVAVILVVAFHAGLPVRGGFIGVDVFLVISGYVITSMLHKELRATGSIRLRTFYGRRIKRLLPALAVLTTAVVALSIVLGSPLATQETTAKTALGATYLSANIVIYNDSTEYFSPDAETNPLLHTWTLSVEEQVYLVFPSLLLLSWVVGRRVRRQARRGAAVMLGVVGVASFAACTLGSFGLLPLPTAFAFYSSLTRVWEFAVGAGLALIAPTLKRIPPKVALALGTLGAIVVLAGAFAISGEMPYPGFAVLAPVLGTAALIAAGSRPPRGVSRFLGTKPMVKIGDVSYSWYLWHWPLIVFAVALWPGVGWVLVVAAAVSLILAGLSTYLLENPVRRRSSIKGWKVVLLALLCTLIPTAAALGLWKGADASWGDESVAAMQAQVDAPHVSETLGCDDASSNGSSLDEAGCQWNATGKGPHVYLVGNSVATMYSEAMIGASKKLDVPLTIDTSQGCFSVIETNRQCSNLFEKTIEKLIARDPGIVVMSSTWDLGRFGGGESTKSTYTVAEKTDALVDSLEGSIIALHDAGHHVVIVLPSPRFFESGKEGEYLPAPQGSLSRQAAHDSAWRQRYCPSSVASVDPADCGATVRLSDVKAAQAKTVDALHEIARATGATTFDLLDHYCPKGICITNDGNRWIFEDGIHITVSESESLAPEFADLLRGIIKEEWGPDRSDRSQEAKP